MPDEKSSSNGAFLNLLANPRQIDVAGAYGQANALAHGVWQNRLAQAQQASGEAQQAAIDPATGEYSPNAYRQNLAARGPQAALAAQSGLASNQSLSTDQLHQALTKLGWVNNASGAALKSGDYSDGAMMKIMQDGAAGGVLTMPEIMRQLATMPPDPAGRKQWLEQHQMRAMSTQQQLEQTYGTRPQVNTGGDIQFPVVPPASAGGAGPVIPTTVDPAVAGSKVTWTDTSGVEQQGTWAQYATERGMGRTVTAPRVAPGAPPQNYTGAPNPLLGNIPNPPEGAVAAPAAAPAPAPSGGATTLTATPGPAPGTVEAANATAKDSAAMGTSLVSRADNVPVNKANYGNMLADLSKLDTMGPGTQRETAINAFLQKLTGHGITMTREQVAGSESFTKLANMIAAQQLGALGPTDARQSLAMGANPHLDLSKLGNQQIIHMLQGNEDAINAKAQAWQKWLAIPGHTAASYGQFTNDFNHNFDPRVFQQQYMSPKEVADLRMSMKGPGEAAKFRHDYQFALDQGWIGQ